MKVPYKSIHDMQKLLRDPDTRDLFVAQLRDRDYQLVNSGAGDVLRDEFFELLYKIGSLAVQCAIEKCYRLIDIFQEANKPFESLESTLRKGYWVRF